MLTGPRIYAHRGSTILAPENTQIAFDLALSMGADVLETDVRLSADNKVIVTHDEDVKRTTDGNGKIRHLPVTEIKKLDAGYRTRSPDGERFDGQGIELMTLDELFEAYPATAINIDIKDSFLQAGEVVANTINRHQRAHNTTVGSFNSDLLLHFRQKAPEVRTAAVRHEVVKLYFDKLAVPFGGINAPKKQAARGTSAPDDSQYAALQIPVTYKMIPLATQRFIKRAKSRGLEICYWTINQPEQMRQLLLLGADGIVTDRPDLADQVFRELGLRND